MKKLLLALSIFTLFSILGKDHSKQIAIGSDQFSGNLYSVLYKEKDNLCFSPISISIAMALPYIGAKSTTLNQMQDAMCYPKISDQKKLKDFCISCGKIIDSLNDAKNVTLGLANKIFLQNFYTLTPQYSNLTHTYFKGKSDEPLVKLMDFNNPEKVRIEINEWVENKTYQKIQNLLPFNSITASTKAVIVNALYFKGDWAHPFKKSKTFDGNFYVSSLEMVPVNMMQQTKRFNYKETEDCQLIELPYKNSNDRKFNMYIILPKEKDGIKKITNNLLFGILKNIEKNLTPENIKISLPKFEIKAHYNLSEVLKSMGMESAFNPNRANFKNMIETNSIHIDKVIHETFIRVDEKGTEAAAATAIYMGVKSMMDISYIEFNANHPFIFALFDSETKMPLFVGKLSDPSKAKIN